MNSRELEAWKKKCREVWLRYKWILLVLAVGIVLLLLPAHEKEQALPLAAEPVEALGNDELEKRLEQALAQIEGAGQVHVVLSVRSGPRRILAQDGKTSQRDGTVDSTISTVVLTKGDRSQETVALQQLSPQYQGALVVCSGGDDPSVRLRLSEAVSTLTGLGADKISICKGK